MPGRTLLALLLSLAPLVGAAPVPTDEPSSDEKLLRDAGVPVDGDGLLTFFRQRTLSEADTKQIGDLIRRLGADDFDDREAPPKRCGRSAPVRRRCSRRRRTTPTWRSPVGRNNV